MSISPIVRTIVFKIWEVLSESYWFIPTLMAVAAVLTAVLSISLGSRLSEDTLNTVGWIYTRDPNAARDLLSMVGGSLITVAGVVFSVTLVALTNASNQFGTRILRTFARDTGNKVVLGAFLGTFLYCLLVMRTITGGQASFVPHLSVLIGIALAIVCFALLIYFIHHVIGILQSDNVVNALGRDLVSSLHRMYPHELGKEPAERSTLVPADFDARSVAICAAGTNYLESVDTDQILELAKQHDVIIRIEVIPGDFILQGAAVARLYPVEKWDEKLSDRVRATFHIEHRRSYLQDAGLGFEQLVLVAIRAMSPAMNNQLLAMTCVDRVADALAFLATRQIPVRYRADSDQNLRVIAARVGYRDAVKLGFDLISESSSVSPSVTVHMLHTIAKLLKVVRVAEMREALMQVARELYERAVQKSEDDVGRRCIQAAFLSLSDEAPELKAA